ncbi:MAG: NAD(P)H-dependent oxidoreductase subunit E [Actinomycetota bacterium]|jgi:NADH-quinone oxidoreductase subunit E|nr:NAD(P)H-dependent oxidoreductase subunit E [Actinomycetota bacterium]
MSANQCGCAESEKQREIDVALFDAVFERYADDPGALIPVLQATQEIFGFLPEVALRAVADARDTPLSEVYGVATFYAQFHLEPRGDTIVRVCHGTACHVRGGDEVAAVISDELGIAVGETGQDLSFTVESVACVGCCGLAPLVLVDDQMHASLDSKSARKLAKRIRRERSR